MHVCSRVRRDEESSLLAELDTMVESVYHPMFRNCDSEFGDVLGRADAVDDIGHGDEVGFALLFGHQDVTSGRDCVELKPRMTWFAASSWCWDRTPVGTGGGGGCNRCSQVEYVNSVQEFHPGDGQ